jgi:alanyl aminopeptidase
MKLPSTLLPALTLLLAACGHQDAPGNVAIAGPDGQAEERVPVGPLPRDVVPVAYGLELTVIPDEPQFHARAEIQVDITIPLSRIWLHGNGLEVTLAEVLLDDGSRVEATYEQVHTDGIVLLSLDQAIEPQRARLVFEYSREFSGGLVGLYRTEEQGDYYAFTDLQPIEARKIFPGFDEPAFKTPFDVAVITRKEHLAFFNSAEIGVEMLDDGKKRVRYATTRPLPTYLFALAVGPLDVVEWDSIPANEWREESIPLRGIAARGKGDKLRYALDNTGSMVAHLEDYFGIAYPFDKLDIVAVSDRLGAMENAGLIMYEEGMILLDDDPPVAQQRSFGASHIHELAHQWFGNLVTMPWWDDLWLNEAFATWIEARGMEAWRPGFNFDRSLLARGLATMDEDSLSAARQIREPVADAEGMYAAFDSITYEKGSSVLAMFESYLGGDVFREGVRLHMRRFAYGTATVFDLIESLEEAAGSDVELEDAFRSFLFQPGVPYLSVELQCDSQGARVALSQQRFLPDGAWFSPDEAWVVPVCLSWDGDQDAETGEPCLLLDEKSADFRVGDHCPGWVMPNRAAAGYYRWRLPDDQTSVLIAGAGSDIGPRERMSLADSLTAGLAAGTIRIEDYLLSLPTQAGARERSVVVASISAFERVFDHLLGPQQRDLAAAYASAIYGRRIELLGLPDGAESKEEAALLSSAVTEFLAAYARDPELREALAEAGRAHVGYTSVQGDEGTTLAPDLVGTALVVAVQDSPPELFDHLAALLRESDDSLLRSQILEALGHAEDPLLLARARNLLLDESVRSSETSPLLAALTHPSRLEGTWTWFEGNAPALVQRFPAAYRFYLPAYFKGFCAPGDSDRLRAVLGRFGDDVPGLETVLRQTEETVAICAAYRERHSADARRFFDELGKAKD